MGRLITPVLRDQNQLSRGRGPVKRKRERGGGERQTDTTVPDVVLTF